MGLVLSGIDKDAFMLFTTHAFILPLSVSVYRVGSAFASSRMDLVWALHGLAVSDAVSSPGSRGASLTGKSIPVSPTSNPRTIIWYDTISLVKCSRLCTIGQGAKLSYSAGT